MSTERNETNPNRNQNEPSAAYANGTPPIAGSNFRRRAKAIFSEFPSDLDAQMKRSPYVALGIAFAIGAGAGVVLGNRILRSVLASAASYGIIELGRQYLRKAASAHSPS
jgi:hypothetical protein